MAIDYGYLKNFGGSDDAILFLVTPESAEAFAEFLLESSQIGSFVALDETHGFVPRTRLIIRASFGTTANRVGWPRAQDGFVDWELSAELAVHVATKIRALAQDGPPAHVYLENAGGPQLVVSRAEYPTAVFLSEGQPGQ